MALSAKSLAPPTPSPRLVVIGVVLFCALATAMMTAWWIGLCVLLLGLGAVARPMEPFPALVFVAATATFVNNEGGHLTRELSVVSGMLVYALASIGGAAAAGTWRLPRAPIVGALAFLAATTAISLSIGMSSGNSMRYLGLELLPILALYLSLLVGGLRISTWDRHAAFNFLVVVAVAHFTLGIYSYLVNRVRTGGIFFTPITGMMALMALSLTLYDPAPRARIWLILVTSAFLLHQLISFTRGYWFGLLVALPYVCIAYGRRGPGARDRWRRVGVTLTWIFVPVAIGVIALSAWFGWTDLASLLATRLVSSVGTEPSSLTASNVERLVEYRATLRSIGEAPILGHGLGYTIHIRQPIFDVVTNQWYVHQTYLWMMLKEGALGLLAYVLTLVAAIRAGTKMAVSGTGEIAGWCAGAAACTIYLAVIGITNFSLAHVNSTFLLGLLWGLTLSLTNVPGYRLTWRTPAIDRGPSAKRT